MGHKPMTLCWDCANACCGCVWSKSLIPVPGWTATPTRDKDGVTSFLVTACPEFQRDCYCGGTSRTPPLTDEELKAKRREQARLNSKNKYRRLKERRASEAWSNQALMRR